MLTLIPNLAISQLNVLYQALNKLKWPAIASIVAGVLNVILAVVFVKYLNFGLFGLALASVISLSLKNVVFTPLYSAKITNQKWYIFYKPLVRSFIISIIISAIGLYIQNYFAISNLGVLILAGITLVIIYSLTTYLFLSKDEKGKIKGIIKKYATKKN